MEPSDRADQEVLGAHAPTSPSRRPAVFREWLAELLDRGAKINDLDAPGSDPAGVPDEGRCAFGDCQGHVRVRLEDRIGHSLEPRGGREIGVLVEYYWQAAPGGNHPPERRGAVAVQV